MRTVRLRVILSTCCSLLSACAMRIPDSENTIPVHVIINTIKCELAEIVNDESYKNQNRLTFARPGKDAKLKLTLTLKIVDTSDISIGVGASSILAFSGALSPSFGLTSTTANTIETQIASLFPDDFSHASLEICNTKNRMGNGIGLKTAILALVEQTTRAEKGQPRIRSDSFKYTVIFGVTREGRLGADFTFVPVKLNASEKEKREDVQTIVFEASLFSASSGSHPYKGSPPKFDPAVLAPPSSPR